MDDLFCYCCELRKTEKESSHFVSNNKNSYHTKYNGTLLSCEKERNNAICSNMDGPKIIILSEVSQTEKDKHHMISLICGI